MTDRDDTARPDPALLLADAEARQRGEDLDGSPRRETREAFEPGLREAPRIDPEFIVIFASAWCNDRGVGIGYDWDGQRFNNRNDAIRHGLKTRGSDDFNIGQTYGDELIWFGWMDERHREDEDTMREIAEAIGLSFDPRWHALEYSKATGEVIAPAARAALTDAPARQRDGSPRREMGEVGENDPLSILHHKRLDDCIMCNGSREWRCGPCPGCADWNTPTPSPFNAPPPDSAPASGETRVTIEKALDFAVMTLASHGRDRGTPRQERMLDDLEKLARVLDDRCRAALASIQPTPATGVDRAGVLEINTPVEKFTGEARWEGVIRAVYTTGKGSLRYVVEVEPQGFQMIAVPSQLRALQPTAAAKPQSEGER